MAKGNRLYIYFVGIDVSRNKLDCSVLHNKQFLFHKVIENKAEIIGGFLNELRTLPKFKLAKAVFCLEKTGIYSNHLLSVLKKYKANVVVEHALRIKNSLGLVRDKHDKIDSLRIAQYAFKNKDELRFWVPRRENVSQLSNLLNLRKKVLGLQLALKTPLKEQSCFAKTLVYNKTTLLCKNSLEALKLDLEAINNHIEKLIDGDDQLKRLESLITSVPCIGRQTGLQIIVSTNEFKDIHDPKKFACFAGVAPFVKESGMFKGRGKVSKLADKKMKSLLHLCALIAVRSRGELKEYFIRKTQEGKSKMSVINAIRNKLILRIFACVNQDRHYEGIYNHKTPPLIAER
jgi:transposase